MTKSNPFYSPMKRASDGPLLAAVLGVPVGALLLLSVLDALIGEPNTGETIAIGCAIVLMLSSLLPQMAGVRFATHGPRSLQNRLAFLGAFFAMMLVGQMPSADQTLARAALGWLPLALVIALVGGMDVTRHIKAMRRHPRALRLLAPGWWVIPLVFFAVAAYVYYWNSDVTLAQTVWRIIVIFTAALGASRHSKLKLDTRRASGLPLWPWQMRFRLWHSFQSS